MNRKYFQPSTIDPHKLEKWHKEYMATSTDDLELYHAVLREVDSDELDMTAIETCIVELTREIPIKIRFCNSCQHMLDNRPDPGYTQESDKSARWIGKPAIARSDCHTLVMEAAARNGCRFCGLLIQRMRDGRVLETFRKVEARLEHVGDVAVGSLSIQNQGEGIKCEQILWMNLPGKVYRFF